MRAKWIERIIGVVGFGLFLSACHQNGTVFAVDTADDTVDVTPGDGLCADANGDCSLRAAVMEANELPGVEEIRVDTDAVLDETVEVTSSVVFTGDGSIRGTNWLLAFDVVAAGLVEFNGLDFALVSRGIHVGEGSTVVVSKVEVAAFGQTFIEVDGGTAVIESSSIHFDFGTGGGGLFGVAIDASSGRVEVENLTVLMESPFLGNELGSSVVKVEDADVNVSASTMTGGFLDVSSTGSGSLVLRGSVFDFVCRGVVASGGYNLDYGGSCGFAAPGDQNLSDESFQGELADNGGGVSTFRLPSGHPAVDAGPEGDCTRTGRDARGVVRPAGARCDIGAFELEQGDCDSIVAGGDLRNCNLAGLDLTNLVLDGADFSGSLLDQADFRGSSMVGADFTGASVDFTDFSGADLTEVVMVDTRGGFIADDALFARATLDATEARSVDRADFTDATAPGFGTWYPTGSMVGAHIEGADFTGSVFWGVTSGGVTGDATGIQVINGYIISQFVQLDGVDFSNHPEDVVFGNMAVRNSDLSNLRITASWAVQYDGSTLDGSDFSGTYTDRSSFRDASLVNVDMIGAQVESTAWLDAIVIGVDFTDASLRRSNFRDAVMLLNTFDNTTCPSGVNSDDNGGNCDGQFGRGGDPLTLAGAEPELLEDAVAVAELAGGGA